MGMNMAVSSFKGGHEFRANGGCQEHGENEDPEAAARVMMRCFSAQAKTGL